MLAASPALAQRPERPGATVSGRVLDATTRSPVPSVLVVVEGTGLSALADSAGRFRFARVPPGPQVLVTRGIGYAPTRVPITLPTTGTLVQDVVLARVALELPGVVVTADPTGRARGELATASVIDRAAVANQTATSLQGVLELVPGVPLSPPGLDDVQQIALRTVPTSTVQSVTGGGPSAEDLGSFGTLIVLDGVPLSNNANLQTLGPRGELFFLLPTSSGGGIDLRRIPASTIERVEGIRGVPSARYGDLTQGVIVVDTRAGAVPPAVAALYDAHTLEGSIVGGREWSNGKHTLSGNLDGAYARLSPGLRDDDAFRLSTQLAHRGVFGVSTAGAPDQGHLVLDSRVDYFQVRQDNPEQPEILPGRASWARDHGLRISERARFALSDQSSLTVSASLDYTRQRSYAQSLLVRGATPVTDRLDEGRSFGRFVLGGYLAQLNLDGEQWRIYSRLEWDRPSSLLGLEHRLRAGAELRREWNEGAGYQFDVEFPPQITFNGVQGYDRPRRFDAIPPVAASAFYLDDRIVTRLLSQGSLDLQAGVRLDLLHEGTTWLSGVRDAEVQPRVNLQLAPRPWLRLRGAGGTSAKLPGLIYLYPAPQYFDVVNVNWFPPDSAERLAVLTTFIRDPTNLDLGLGTGRTVEAGFEVAPGRGDVAASLVYFDNRATGGGYLPLPGFLLRDRYDFVDSTTGTGVPPTLIEPPTRADTVPIVVDQPANNLTLENHGFELTARLPELRPLRTRLEVQAAWTKSEFVSAGPDFGPRFSEFQLDERIPRAPYWEAVTRTGERTVFTYRLVHHQPTLGLVVTAVIQHIPHETRQNVGATDSLAFAGYITRTGELVPVPPERRGDAEFADLQVPRLAVPTEVSEPRPDWMMNLQVSKTLPADGELRFYAFNVLDRVGRFGERVTDSRTWPPMRFGVELTVPLPRP